MQKDVVYIDVEDDITAIIGKVKTSKEKIVALVPPKRIGVLQSAVNLRLLERAAKSGDKRLVLITNDQALMGLAAAAKIPVAKNLQSKPEIAEVPALSVDDDDDIIDGETLPVGDFAKTASAVAVADSTLDKLNIDDDAPKAMPPRAGNKPGKGKVKSGVKVPSFDAFRKKAFLIAGGVILLIVFLIWAIFFAPRATVVISAETSPTEVKTSVAIGPSLTTDAEASTLKSVAVQDKQSQTVEFAATGTKDVGTKATGSVILSNCASRDAVSFDAGTAVSSGGMNYFMNTSVTVPGGRSSSAFGSCDRPGTATVAVTAEAVGQEYNLAANSSFQVAGGAGVTASNGSALSGGEKREIKIVTQGDVNKAKEQLVAQKGDDAKNKLKSKFDDNTTIIDDSFQSVPADPQVAPAIGQEAADGKAKLTSEVTYSMSGVEKAELSKYLQAALEKTIDKDEQRVYEDGADTAKMTDFKSTNGNTTVTLTATGQVGPKINDDDIKERVKGKNFGEIQSDLKSIEGVNDADVKFWPFWVNTVPNDTSKITIEFKLQNE